MGKLGVTIAGIATGVILAGCSASVGGSTDYSSSVASDMQSNAASQLQTNLDASYPDAAVTIDDVSCVESGDTQNYSCIMHVSLNAPAEGLSAQMYLYSPTATCDDSGNCTWNTGTGTAQG